MLLQIALTTFGVLLACADPRRTPPADISEELLQLKIEADKRDDGQYAVATDDIDHFEEIVGQPPDGPSVQPELMVELAVFVDFYLWKGIFDRMQDRQRARDFIQRALSAMAGQTQALYTLPSMKHPMLIKIVHFEIWDENQPADLCDECVHRDVAHQFTANLSLVLEIFNKMPLQTSGDWDAAVLISEQKATAGGLSPVGGVCNKAQRGFVVVSLDAFALPHELGHTLNMHHDLDYEISCWNANDAKHQFSWSARNLWRFNRMWAGGSADCLRVTNYDGPAVLETSLDPARDYTAQEDCWYWSGSDAFTLYSWGHNDYPTNWCTYVVCGDANGQSRTNTALYKQPCGDNKYCFPAVDWGRYNVFCGTAEDERAQTRYNYAFGVCEGNDLTPAEPRSQQECEEMCSSREDCKAYAFTHSEEYAEGTCQLKSRGCFEQLVPSSDKRITFYIKEFDLDDTGQQTPHTSAKCSTPSY